ncbi:mitochondrial carrier domain-containing protein [Pavlovales sp. CCMP2436]|nr:mitochondrial carrier domain-containing protein [Pavlovales sp. CCMP2436]
MVLLNPCLSVTGLMTAESPDKSFSWRTPTAQLLVVSGVSWVFEGCCGHQLEFVKIIKQTTKKPYPVILREIVAQKGVVGLWDGFFPWGSVQAISKGAVFGWANALVRKSLKPAVDSGSLSRSASDTIAGAGAGGVQGFSCEVGARVIAREGPMSLMKGAPTFAIKRVADWGSRYLFVNLVEDVAFRRGDTDGSRKLAYSQQIAASLLGGVLSSICTVPLDVMVAQIQQAAKAGEAVSVWGTFRVQWAEGGFERVAGFATRGFVARCIHVALTTVVIKTGTEFVTDVLEGTNH